MKRMFVLLTAMILVIALAACGSNGPEKTSDTTEATTQLTTDNETVSLETDAAESVPFGDAASEEVWVNDGETTITDSHFDSFFAEGARDGVENLLNEGRIKVNGIAVPASESDTEDYQVNFVSSLYKTDSGWGYNVHKTTSADNLSFDDARMGMVETISTVRGHTTVLELDADGMCVGIDISSIECMLIDYFEDHGSTVDKISRGDFELETERVRFDGNNVTVDMKNWDDEIAIGDIVVYWYSADGWHMKKAVPITCLVSKNEDRQFVINETDVRTESNISRYNLINSSRPTQFYNDTYSRLELNDIECVIWCTDTGHPIGFTFGDNSVQAITRAIEFAENAKENVQISTDGSDVPSDNSWTTQEAMDAFDAAIEEARSVLNDNSSSNMQLDFAIYKLAQAYGQSGEKPSGFAGSLGEGRQ